MADLTLDKRPRLRKAERRAVKAALCGHTITVQQGSWRLARLSAIRLAAWAVDSRQDDRGNYWLDFACGGAIQIVVGHITQS